MEDSINSQWASTWLRPHQKRDLLRRFIEPTVLCNSHDSHDNNTQANWIRIPNFQISRKDFPPTLHGWPQTIWKVIKWVRVTTQYSTDIQHRHLNGIRPTEMRNTDNTQRKSNPHWRAHIVKQQHYQRAESRRELQVPRYTAGRGRQTSSSEEANICRIYQQST